MIPSANIVPALSMPIWPIWIVTGERELVLVLYGHTQDRTAADLLPRSAGHCWVVPPRRKVTVIGWACVPP